MDYIEPRSVKRLEDEIAELERQELERLQGGQEETEQEDEPVKDAAPLDKEEETYKKRYSDLRRHTQTLTDKIKALEKAQQERERSEKMPNFASIEEAKEWAEANPKAAEIIRAIASEQVTNIAPKFEDVQAVEEKLTRLKQESAIRKVHPDFDDIVADDEFHDWAESQPSSVQKLVYQGDASDVIWAINAYKKEKAIAPNPAKDAAKSVRNKGSSSAIAEQAEGRFSESQVQKMSLQEYEKNAAAIEKSVKAGTFVYDLSGAAR